jgi:hypothetical protein
MNLHYSIARVTKNVPVFWWVINTDFRMGQVRSRESRFRLWIETISERSINICTMGIQEENVKRTRMGCALHSGDGGNRTRVRKTRPTEIYERSRWLSSPQVIPPAKSTCGQPLGPEGPLSRSQRRRARHSTFMTPSPFTGWSTGRVDAASSRRPAVYSCCLRSEGHSGVGSAVGT